MNIQQHGSIGPRGELQGQVTRDLGVLTARHLAPVPPGWRWRNWLRYRRRDLPKLAASRLLGALPGLLSMEATLQGAVYRAQWAALAPWQAAKLRELLAENVNVFELPAHFGGVLTNYGVLSTRVVTNAGVAFLVDGFQNLVELENLKYHGFGTGDNAEDATDTALETELTTEYASDNTRPAGSTTEGASANIYRSVATLSPDSGGTIPVTEHGVFSQAANSGGVCFDRSVFSAVNLVAGADSLQVTYDLTVASGG